MMNQTNIKTILAVIGLVLIGFLIGFFTNRYLTIQRIHTLSKLGAPRGFQEHLLNVIDASERQKADLTPVIEEFSDKMGQIHKEFRGKRLEVLDSLNLAIKGHLTPEQVSRFEVFKRRFKGGPFHKRKPRNLDRIERKRN